MPAVRRLGAICGIYCLGLPLAANGQTSLVVTQIGYDQRDAAAASGICSTTACRANLPVTVGTDLCVLNVLLETPRAGGTIQVTFAAGPCRSNRRLAVADTYARTAYQPDTYGALTRTFLLPFEPAGWRGAINDGVVHPAIKVRLDVIAAPPPADPSHQPAPLPQNSPGPASPR